MSTARFIVGDALTVMRSMPAGSVDLILTSPPFLALRSYLPADHPDKAKEMGSEATPGAFIDTLLDLTEEARRVLAPHGSLCVELGDTYAGSGGAGGDYNANGMRDGQERFDGSASRAFGTGAVPRPARVGRTTVSRRRDREEVPRNLSGGHGWPLDKSLCLIPELYRIALVYGFNPLTGRETPRWRARNVVRWVRPNPPVGALADKFRNATSEMVVACTGRKRYFDLDAVRTEHSKPNGNGMMRAKTQVTGSRVDDGKPFYNEGHPAGAPPLDWWLIPTEPFSGAHYATFPRALCVRPIEAMCPRKVCTSCGKPSERITGEVAYMRNGSPCEPDTANFAGLQERRSSTGHSSRSTPTLGWTDCEHDSWRPGLVLDPFAGSGTTLAVASGHGRASIGVDLDARNADLARERVGMWLEVEYAERTPA